MSPSVVPVQGRVDRVYQSLLARIIDGELKEGDRLAPEQALAQSFQTSRPTVREALSRLRADGIITSRQGSGTFVARRPDPDIPRFIPLESLSDVRRCLEFRTVLESGAAALAAEMASEADLAKLRAALAQLQEAVTSRAVGADEDFEFHLAVAQASKNPFFVSVLTHVRQHTQFGMNLLRNLSLNKTAERNERVLSEHSAVLAAIERRDPQAAQLAMRNHLTNTLQRMFGD
jgi:GntR family transcriptional regulator, transcriptional repressor for pyruvate dehydrogenase complex